MPATKKQVKSNRKNAKNSTGPKSKEGKAIAAKNAVRHGLYSKDLVINSCNLKEDEDEFNQLKNDLYDDYQPVGPLEESLVDKITNAIWRSRRVARAEVAIVNRQLRRLSNMRFSEPDWSDKEDQQDFLDNAHANSIPNSSMTANILRYEMRLDRQITRSYALLLHVQQRRCDTMMDDLKAGKLKNIQQQSASPVHEHSSGPEMVRATCRRHVRSPAQAGRSASQGMVQSASQGMVLNAGDGFARNPRDEQPNYNKPPRSPAQAGDPPDENYKYSEPPDPTIEKPEHDTMGNEKPKNDGTDPIPPNTQEDTRLQRLLEKADYV